jgi:hypothetical protein
MFRKLAGAAVLGVLVCATAVYAAEVKGKVVKVDDANNKITIKVDDKEKEYTVAKDVKMPKNRRSKDGTQKDLTLKDFAKMVERAKDDVKVTVTTEKKDGKETVTEIKFDMAGRTKKGKDKDKKDGN